MQNSLRLASLAFGFGLLLAACKTPETLQPAPSSLAMSSDDAAATSLDSLPLLTEVDSHLPATLAAVKKGRNLPLDTAEAYAERVARYLAFLGLEPGEKVTKNTLARLMESSTKFLFCDDFEDWVCLEQAPEIVPSAASRVDVAADLGAPVTVQAPFQMEAYLTEQWDTNQPDLERALARKLAAKIREYGTEAVWMAIYGIDEIDGSMKPVYDAIVEKIDAGVPVEGVFDTEDYNKEAEFPLSFTYKKSSKPNWIFADAANGKSNLLFQYKSSIDLINRMNKGITTPYEGAWARVEKPDSIIMHNKFMVFQNEGHLSVWTGTANISDTCMGSDRNTNMGIFIKNEEIAQTFLDEFKEMFEFKATPFVDKKGRYLNASGGPEIPIGAFKNDKRPNTKRYFRFQDGHEVRVHFAPTDDGEHRVLIPMILAARPGDKLRISMFGGGGYEFVRAFQYAASRGVEIQIVFDRLTGSGNFSWIKNAEGTILDENPYGEVAGSIEVHKSTWKGLNHHKTATLSRVVNGVEIPVMMVIGSQNWSKTGNDENDENMVTIRNPKGIAAGRLFNEQFDNRMWPISAAGAVSAN